LDPRKITGEANLKGFVVLKIPFFFGSSSICGQLLGPFKPFGNFGLGEF